MKFYLAIPFLALLFSVTTAEAKSAPDPTAPNPYVLTGGNPGIVVSGSCEYSQIPEEVRNFIHKHFKNNAVAACKRDYNPMEYEVRLDDGTQIEFDEKGRWTEIEAGRAGYIPAKLVKHLLPGNAYRKIEGLGVMPFVDEVHKLANGGYEVDLNQDNLGDFKFDKHGRLVEFERDY